MLFTLSWLRQLLTTTADAEKIAATLGQIGFEVESMVDRGAVYQSFLIAQITEAIQHPGADRLKVCKVFDGKQELQIICGGVNARAGIKVVLAPVGTMMPVDKFMIKAAKIRGVDSNGMMCSAAELGLSGLVCPEGGIIELPEDAPVGGSFKEYQGLAEVIFDISITPNRGDALSIMGMARDLAATGLGSAAGIPDSTFAIANIIATQAKLHQQAPKDCSSFALRYVHGLSNGAAPTDIAKQLAAINSGSADKGALVAISNYAMFTYGRPNHIYDAAKVQGDVYIRYSKAGEEFIAIGGAKYDLPVGLLVIADEVKVLAIAGVMGGELSKVDENTKDIIIEVANFSQSAVAQSGRALGLLSDSRYRFERRIDPSNDTEFMDCLTSMVLSACGGTAHATIKVEGDKVERLATIWVNYDRIRGIAGVDIPDERINQILTALGFSIDSGTATVPAWRQGDVDDIEDLAEEVLRIHGFHNVHGTPLVYASDSIRIPPRLHDVSIKEMVANRLGLFEVITWSFMHSVDLERYQLRSSVTLDNPINSTLDVMRPSIIPNLVKLVQHNLARGQTDFGVFELGSIYGNTLPDYQTPCIAGLRVGGMERRSVHKNGRDYDFFDGKADFLEIANILGCSGRSIQITTQAPGYYHPGQSASFMLGNKVLGYAGMLHPRIAQEYDIDEPVVMFEVFTAALPKSKERYTFGAKLSDLQAVSRDFAFIMDEQTSAADVVKAVQSLKEPLVEDIQIFDVYRGTGVENGKKSIAFGVRLQPQEQTMTEGQIDEISSSIIAVITKLGGVLR